MMRRTALRLAGTQGAGERMMEQIPVVGAPLVAASNPGTYEELAELKKTADPAAAVTERFIYNQKKLVAYRIHRMRTEYNQFLENPFAMGPATPVALARTAALAFIMYLIGFYLGSGGHGVDVPGVGILVGTPFQEPVRFWEKKE